MDHRPVDAPRLYTTTPNLTLSFPALEAGRPAAVMLFVSGVECIVGGDCREMEQEGVKGFHSNPWGSGERTLPVLLD